MQVLNPFPNIHEVADAFRTNLGRHFSMQYHRIKERRERPGRETLYSDPETSFKGHTGQDQGEVFSSSEGNFLFRTLFSTRRNAETKEFEWRSLRLDAIPLDTVLFNDGPNGNTRMFPNVPPGYKAAPASVEVLGVLEVAEPWAMAQDGRQAVAKEAEVGALA